MANIRVSIEEKRGCGFRKPGGLYLMGGGVSAPCCKLPFPLTVCPCCGGGVKFTRGFTWINTDLFPGSCADERERLCVLNLEGVQMGLLWVGELFYSTPGEFSREADRQGISRRISAVPRGFEVGKTWVALAHIKAINGESPGIFRVFRPDRIEYVIAGNESAEELEALEKRGISLVRVERAGAQQGLNFEQDGK